MWNEKRQAIVAAALLAASALLAPRSQAQRRDLRDEPRPAIYRTQTGIWLLDLPPAMEDALDRYNRDFEAWSVENYPRLDYAPSPRQVPWAVIGDFNGDGRADLAVAGRTDRDAVVVFVLSNGRARYRAVETEREPYDPEDRFSIRAPVLTYMYPGRYVVDDPRLAYPRQIIVDQPGVQITGGRRQGAVVYVVENNAVVPYYLSDRTAAPVPRGGRSPVAPPRRIRPDRPDTVGVDSDLVRLPRKGNSAIR
jgi:hypothetical protein